MSKSKYLIAISLKRKNHHHALGEYWEWMIANGSHMGKWKMRFDVTCLADNSDCQRNLENQRKMLIEEEGYDEEDLVITEHKITVGEQEFKHNGFLNKR